MKALFPVSQLPRLFSIRLLSMSLLLAFCYLCLLIYAPNYRLLGTLLQNNYTVSAKLTILVSLFFGGFETQSLLGLLLLLLTALLIGLNGALLIQSYQTVRKNGKAHVAVGGSMVLGFVSTSCAVVCGFSLLPFIGTTLGASFSLLDGIPFRLLTVILLSLSLGYTLLSTQDKRAWLVTRKKGSVKLSLGK